MKLVVMDLRKEYFGIEFGHAKKIRQNFEFQNFGGKFWRKMEPEFWRILSLHDFKAPKGLFLVRTKIQDGAQVFFFPCYASEHDLRCWLTLGYVRFQNPPKFSAKILNFKSLADFFKFTVLANTGLNKSPAVW